METDPSGISFVDLAAQSRVLGPSIEEAINRVLQHGQFIMGPEVAELEKRLGEFCGAKHVVTCSSGTDALRMVLMAWDVGPGAAVFVPSFTFAATAEAVALVGATPVFVDVDDSTFTLDPDSLAGAVEMADRAGLLPAVVIPVDLYGLPADYPEIRGLASRFRLKVLGDGAQSFGGAIDGVRVGRLADATATSFFPAKPLGCYGDGGAVFTDDEELASLLRSIRVHGQGRDKYDNVRIGMNCRLDTLQASILLAKLRIFADELVLREQVAHRYRQLLGTSLRVQNVPRGVRPGWAHFTVVLEDRDDVRTILTERKIPTAIYYALPLHRQPAFAACPRAPDGLPTAESLADRVLSLPMHPYLEIQQQDQVISALLEGLAAVRAT